MRVRWGRWSEKERGRTAEYEMGKRNRNKRRVWISPKIQAALASVMIRVSRFLNEKRRETARIEKLHHVIHQTTFHLSCSNHTSVTSPEERQGNDNGRNAVQEERTNERKRTYRKEKKPLPALERKGKQKNLLDTAMIPVVQRALSGN